MDDLTDDVIDVEARVVDGPGIALRPAPGRIMLPSGEQRTVVVAEGMSVRQIIEGCVPEDLWPMVEAFNHGRRIDDWDTFKVRPADAILILCVPQGGGGNKKGIIGAILAIAVAVVAWYAAPAVAGMFVGGTASAGAITATQIGITLVGNLLISALVRPPSVNTGNVSTGAATSYSLTGQSNAARPFSACIVVYGRHKLYPVTATNPRIENLGTESKLTALYDLGLGYVNFYDLRIGDVDINQFQPGLAAHWNSYCDDLRLNFNRIGYDQYAIEMQQNEQTTIRTKPNSYAAELDIQFPLGIAQVAPAYSSIPYWIVMNSQWRRANSNDPWQAVPIDWFLGAMGRNYVTPPVASIQYMLNWGGFEGQWLNYDPATSPAQLRDMRAQFLADSGQQNPYPNFKPNPGMAMAIMSTPPYMNDADYFSRYPDIYAAGWPGYRSAWDHFQSIGSREGRNPGVMVMIGAPPLGWYDPNTSPTTLHNWDVLSSQSDPLVGGWRWIQQGRPVWTPPPVPMSWRMTAGEFDGAGYLARYPDVAASGIDPWVHFTTTGSFEGRNPYDNNLGHDVQLIANFLGPYWLRIVYNFPAPGQYDLRVMRTDKVEDGTDSTISTTSGGAVTGRVNKAVIALLRSYEAGAVVQPQLRHTMLEMQVRATDKLQGVVQTLNLLAVGVLPVTNDGVNFWYAETRNPAWVALDLMTSEKNPRPVPRESIDWPSWLHLAGICETLRSWVVNGQPFTAARFLFDAVIVDFTTVKETVDSILSGCRASLMLMTNGKWGVLVDEEKNTPRQYLTPSNSWGFTGTRSFSQVPHCLRVTFINMETNYQTDTVNVYADGFSAANATIFETLDTYGITDYPHAWAYGRYMMAQGIMRSEMFSVTMDVENLVAQRGDRVDVAHDVPRMGGVSGRVVETLPNNQIRVTRELMSMMPSGYAVRTSIDGLTRVGRVFSADGHGTFALDDTTNIAPDDLIVFGDYDRVIFPYLVQQITPGPDLTAELTLVRYDPQVYQADVGLLPAWDPGIGRDFQNGTDLATTDVTLAQQLVYVNREPRCNARFQWVTTGYALHHHSLVIIWPSGKREQLGELAEVSFLWVVDALRQRKYFDIALQVEVTPVSEAGFIGVPGYLSFVLVPDRTPPGAPIEFGVNVQKETVDMFWQHPPDPDIGSYVIRYTPEVIIPSWDSSTLLANVGWPTTKASAGARTGTYMIRCADTSGNYSPVVMRRTTVAHLPDINVIEVLDDRYRVPPWPGVHDMTYVRGGVLMTVGEWGAIPPQATYRFRGPLNLGDVFESRVSAKLMAMGVTQADMMHNWPTLSAVARMLSATTDMWNVWLELRTSDKLAFMDEWQPLSSIDPIATGSPSSWSEWRWIEVADVTAQLLQFRIRLQSNNPGVRPTVKSGRVEIDMPDRVDAYPDVYVPTAGIDFFWQPAFREVLATAITIDGSEDPLMAIVSDRSDIGIRLRLVHMVTGEPRAGQCDIMAKGYGRLRPASI